MVKEAGLVTTELARVIMPAFTTEIGVQKADVDDQVLAAILKDREAETYQFVIKAVRDDATTSLENLSDEVIGLTDRLLDEVEHHEALRAEYEALQEKYAEDLQDLARLRHQLLTVKRFLPMTIIRFVRRLFGDH
jgi:predicted  nucleic acid-binding Zn-ribbon protein